MKRVRPGALVALALLFLTTGLAWCETVGEASYLDGTVDV
ncbi:MAG: hypothetical protein HW381_694, partial [Candidatus Rokubacteria bacterium]|nr:hypothetical protein [Candidatus Rokubacteria bacterium]